MFKFVSSFEKIEQRNFIADPVTNQRGNKLDFSFISFIELEDFRTIFGRW